MKVKIYPGKCHGEVNIPSSKSLAHRALICASLANGRSIIKNVSMNNDIEATISCLKALGAIINIDETTIYVDGINNIRHDEVILDANESGSTLRFLIPLSSYLSKKVYFKGSEKLISRPLSIYKELYDKENLTFLFENNMIKVSGALKTTEYTIDGNISSQFISGLLFYLPLLEKDSRIIIKNDYQSKSYVDLTISSMKQFGVNILEEDDGRTLIIKGKQKYNPSEFTVEGDFSQAAFFLTLGAINNDVKVNGLNINSRQGDKEIVSILKRMNGKIEVLDNSLISKKSQLTNIDINLENIPDLGPILCVLLSQTKGMNQIYHAQRLRYKESDRIAAIEEELKKFNIDIYSDNDNIYINGGKEIIVNSERIYSHNDHRIFMSIAVLSTISSKPVTIYGGESINKSYPNFLLDLKKLGIKVEIENE